MDKHRAERIGGHEYADAENTMDKIEPLSIAVYMNRYLERNKADYAYIQKLHRELRALGA